MNTAQQILALDVRYNTYRAPNNPQFRTLYIRRRSQLLREKAKQEKDPSIRRQYLIIRKQLLAQRYGSASVAETVSRSISIRSRTSSIEASFDSLHLDSPSHDAFRPSHRRYNTAGFESGSSFNFMTDDQDHGVTPTTKASASRAMAGNTSLGENYAFSGMFHIFDQHADSVTAVKFGHNDKFKLACSSLDGTLSVCNLSSSPPSVSCTLHGHSGGVTDFDWSLANDFILSASLDGTARVWNPVTGQNIRVISDTYGAAVLSCRFMPLNNNMLITGNQKGQVQVYNMSTGKCFKGGSAKAVGPVRALEFDSSGTILWSGDDKGSIFSFSFDVMTGKLHKARRIIVADNCAISSLSCRTWISREARDPSLLVNCSNNTLYLYRILSTDGNLKLKSTFPIHHKKHSIRSSFCPLMSFRQGACVVTGSEDMTVYFFNVEQTNKPLNKLLGHSAPVIAVSWNYDESLLASSDTELLSGNEVGRVNGRLLVTKLPVTLDSAITDIEMWHTDQRRETGYLQLFVSGSLFIALKRSH